MKKILSTLLALIMLLSFSIPASAAGTANFKKVNSYKQGQFTDVPTEWYSDYVKENSVGKLRETHLRFNVIHVFKITRG